MSPHFDDLVVNRWGARFMGRTLMCSIGRSGIGQKSGEGDGITPIGAFRICEVRYRADRVSIESQAFQTRAVGPNDIWSDDPTDLNYNQGLSAANYPYSHERLYRADPLYDAFAVLDFNWPVAQPGAGSAIFLHIWRKPRHPTEGCVAFDRHDFLRLLSEWQSTSRVIIQG